MTDKPNLIPANFGLKARKAVADLVSAIKNGFTGNFSIDMRDGVPQVRRRTDTHRYGKKEKDLTEDE